VIAGNRIQRPSANADGLCAFGLAFDCVWAFVTPIRKAERMDSGGSEQRCEEGSMTIDERLEKLTERHEALTQTVELMAAENRAGFARLQRVEQILGQLAQSMDTLARVVELHEQRLDDLEGHRT
jgi:hypothetical protein